MNQFPQDNQGPVGVVMMAAGKDARMKISLPKVLHRLRGRALLTHMIGTARRSGTHHSVVARRDTTRPTSRPRSTAPGRIVRLLALALALALARARVLVAESIDQRLALALLFIGLNDPTGYGCIVRPRHRWTRKAKCQHHYFSRYEVPLRVGAPG